MILVFSKSIIKVFFIFSVSLISYLPTLHVVGAKSPETGIFHFLTTLKYLLLFSGFVSLILCVHFFSPYLLPFSNPLLKFLRHFHQFHQFRAIPIFIISFCILNHVNCGCPVGRTLKLRVTKHHPKFSHPGSKS